MDDCFTPPGHAVTAPGIAEFITARLDEEEKRAAMIGARAWRAGLGADQRLREVAALQAIVQWCIPDASVETALENGDISAEDYVTHKTVGAHVLRHVASIWADHPDCQQEWEPPQPADAVQPPYCRHTGEIGCAH